jgi:hypothetical protein
MRDWELLVEDNPWVVGPGDTVVIDDEIPWPRGQLESLPDLSAILKVASLTPVSVSARRYEVIAWGPPDDRRGWLCEPPVVADLGHVHPTHRQFWTVCGGIVERFAEPESWWMNQEDILTAEAARTSVAEPVSAYDWIWTDAGLEVPIEPDDYYPVAVEGNGNLTLAHRRTGQIVLFAPDHDFDRVTVLPGCPEYSLYTIDGVPDLSSWIEECARVWLSS